MIETAAHGLNAGMEMERINPVALVCGAASGLGTLCAQAISRRAEGGLILVDSDEAALDFTADALTKPPERVSTLAFDPRAPEEWKRGTSFIAAHYGRLDWVLVVPPPLDARGGETGLADLDAAQLALRSLGRLQRNNVQGGAAALVLGAQAAMKAHVLQVLRAAAGEGAANKVRVNAVVVGGADAPAWRNAVAVTRFDHATLETLANSASPVARCPGYNVTGMAPFLLSDKHTLTGATLVVDDIQAL